MKIYQLGYKEATYTYLNPGDCVSYVVDNFNGNPIDNWTPFQIKHLKEQPKILYDCTALNPGCPIFNQRVVEELHHFIKDKVEILPLLHPDTVFAINVINVIDCLDYDRAKFVLNLKYNIVTEVKEYAFKPELIRNETIFKMPQHRGSRIFVTDVFKNIVLEKKLTGFEFDEVWDSELDHIGEPQEIPVITYGGKAYSFGEALELVEDGTHAFANDRWKFQKDKDDNLILGYLTIDKGYDWSRPLGFPPTFINEKWYIVDKS